MQRSADQGGSNDNVDETTDFFEDIESEQTAQKLQTFLVDVQDRMGTFLQLMPIGLAVHQQHSILFANKELCSLLGLTHDEVIGRHILDFIEFDESLGLFQRFADVFSGGDPIREPSLSLTGADDMPHMVQLMVQRMPWKDQPVTQILVQDISHIKAMEYELHRKSQDIASALFRETRARKVQRDFVSVISHEFRTPLTIINGAAQMIEKAVQMKKYDKVHDKVKKIRRAVDRTNKLIDDILVSSTAEKNKFKIDPQPLDLAALIAGRAESMEDSSKTHKIDCELGDLPDEIIADRKACIHIIENLLSNAVKYSPDADLIEIRGWEAGGSAIVSFRDFGVGVESNEVSRLFDQYFRASTSHGIAGTGIGLNLVKKLLELQGGYVLVESEVGEGTTFTISLPIRARSEEE
ncbi:MAG: PAS domain-containing sensor histidine kinase [Kordiimonadaceae bacterium]|nr:PAS domain-containing sensor histidine kinase [Kordiimonadaceae bacterium]